MKGSYERRIAVLPSICDASVKLGYANTFAAFMDIASEHAEMLGVGGAAMAAKKAFWLTVRTRIAFYGRPRMMQEATVKTWPLPPAKLRCDRMYKLYDENTGKVYAEGRTEWAVLDTVSGKVVPVESIGFPELDFDAERVCDAPFIRFRDETEDREFAAEFTVMPSDTDYGNHMNNVAYVRKILDTTPTAEQAKMKIREIEINFCRPCYEGEKVQIYRRRKENTCFYTLCRGDTALAFACIK